MNSIIFVCSKCHSLCCFDADYDEQDSSGQRQLIGQKDIELEEKSKLKLNKNILEKFTENPICSVCIEKELLNIKMQNDFISNFEKTLIDINITKVENTANLFTGSEILQDSNDINLKKNIKTEGTEENSQIQRDLILLKNINENRNKKKISSQRMCKSYASHLCFNISYSGHYGTINSMRIGSLRSSPVPQEEVQNGLYLICRYLKHLLNLNNIQSDDFIINSSIIFFINLKQHELLYKEKKLNVGEFNTALDRMMTYFEKLFTVLSTKAISPPNSIETSKKMISGRSYLYSPNDPFDFVLAMKRLLINLKAFQLLETFT